MSERSAAALLLVQQAVLGLIAQSWLSKVCTIVPEPYLDEVFHIRQAQAYLDQQWHIWDPKITTPPGLYLVSYVQQLFLRPLGVHESDSPWVLRSTNVIFGVILLPVLVRELLFLINSTWASSKGKEKVFSSSSETFQLGHTALNICLFPPLFFFYGLYYTDVLSVVSVLCAYHCYLKKAYVKVIFAGLASLCFRQTNVFWTAIFLGGLELVRTLPTGRPDVEFPRRVTFYDVVLGSWNHACVYNPFVSDAYFEDYAKTVVSLAVSAVSFLFKEPITLFWNLSSYVLILLAFGEFVLWNGGVVLGDKENHIASVHLAQMLYIWPYFFFFSFPLLAPYLLNALIPQNLLPPILQSGSQKHTLPRFAIIMPTLAVMLAIVHYNTIVHPFTLADNRHYMFYVFRLLLRHPIIKYLAVPIYLALGWTCLTALGGPTTQSTTKAAPKQQGPQQLLQNVSPLSRDKKPPSDRTNRITFLLIWLITTTLTLSSAPLVEPRYLILPWLMWRLHITPIDSTAPPPHTSTKKGDTPSSSRTTSVSSRHASFAPTLWLETAWFLLINLGTGYIFLYWGFEWPQEPGRVQRFMW